MAKTFDITAETTQIGEWEFTSYQKEQAARAEAQKVERIFKFRAIHKISGLPKYVAAAIESAGYTPVIVGGTTYKHTVIGLVKN